MFLLNFLKHQDCLLCGGPCNVQTMHAGDASNILCHACAINLPHHADAACVQCAAPGSSGICGNCLSEHPAFDSTTAAFSYSFPLDKLIQSLKFNANFALPAFFAEVFSKRFSVSGLATPEILIPLPLGAARLKKRGFNQAALLAQSLVKKTGVRLELGLLSRIRDTLPQMELKWKERHANVKGAFACHADLSGKRVALIDDVMTTGATLSEAAKTLKKQGAVEVQAWVIARATLRSAMQVERPLATVAFNDGYSNV